MPNILLITSDQQLHDTLGFKNPHIKTPNLDRLARGGADFTRAYCPNPLCTPTRASIITGLYPSAHHAWTIGVKLPEDVPTVGQQFLDAGYHTALIGKAHFQPLASGTRPGEESIECQPILRDLDFWRDFHRTHSPWYGFAHVETCRNHADESHVGGHYAIWLEQHGLKDWRDYYQSWPPKPKKDEHGNDLPYWMLGRRHTWDLPEHLHYTPWTAERTCEVIRRSTQSGQPFFAWASFHDPHPPYLVPEPWASMYDPADMPIGRITPGELDHMPPPHHMTRDPKANWSVFRERGGHGCHGYGHHRYDEATLRKDMAIYYGMVSFMDHHIGRILDELDRQGLTDDTVVVFTSDHGHYIGHHGLNAKGAFHYEEGVRVPFIARWPGHIPAGATNSSLNSLVDLAPTFLSASGLPVPGIMQGVNQLPGWSGQRPSVRDHCIVENRHQPTRVHLRTFITDRYKLTLYQDHLDWGELFDLQHDPAEVRNLFHDPGSAAIKLELMHRFLNAEIGREMTRMPRVAGA